MGRGRGVGNIVNKLIGRRNSAGQDETAAKAVDPEKEISRKVKETPIEMKDRLNGTRVQEDYDLLAAVEGAISPLDWKNVGHEYAFYAAGKESSPLGAVTIYRMDDAKERLGELGYKKTKGDVYSAYRNDDRLHKDIRFGDLKEGHTYAFEKDGDTTDIRHSWTNPAGESVSNTIEVTKHVGGHHTIVLDRTPGKAFGKDTETIHTNAEFQRHNSAGPAWITDEGKRFRYYWNGAYLGEGAEGREKLARTKKFSDDNSGGVFPGRKSVGELETE